MYKIQRMMYPVKLEQDYIARNLLDAGERLPQEVRGMTYQQLSLFDDEMCIRDRDVHAAFFISMLID